jgi:hypothetical protein
VKKIKILSRFIKDISIAKKNVRYSGYKSSYFLLRFFYFISNGLLLTLIEKIIKTPIKVNKFKDGIKFEEKIEKKKIEQIKKEIFKLDIISNIETHRDIPIKFNNFKNDFDYEYYKNNKVVRLSFKREQLIANKEISKFILDNDFSKIISNLIGQEVFLQAIDSWITLPIPEVKDVYEEMTKYEDTQNWHRDVDNLRDLKVFIYFSDTMNIQDGPFEIIKNTNMFHFFNPLRYYDKIKLRVKNNFVQKKFKNQIVTIKGEAGTVFIADTRALHRGRPILKENRYRMVFQLYYSTHAFGKDNKIELKENYESYSLWQDYLEKNKHIALFDLK